MASTTRWAGTASAKDGSAGSPSSMARRNASAGFAGESPNAARASAHRLAFERDDRLAVELVAHGTEHLVLDHDVESLAEQLDVSRTRPLQDVVPDGHQRCHRAVRKVHPSCGDVVDVRMAVDGAGRCRDCLDRAEPPAQDVDVVDGVLDHRSSSGASRIDAPVGAVETLDGDELIVSERHGEHAPCALVG